MTAAPEDIAGFATAAIGNYAVRARDGERFLLVARRGVRTAGMGGRAETMTTEEDFQAALDMNLADWQTRLVFADWLQERVDPRADGYRALGVGRRYPLSVRMAATPWRGHTVWVYGGADSRLDNRQRHCLLAVDWFERIERGEGCDKSWRRRLKRREAEDAAALAFAKLPPGRQTGLLVATPTTKKPRKRPKGAEVNPPESERSIPSRVPLVALVLLARRVPGRRVPDGEADGRFACPAAATGWKRMCRPRTGHDV